jgi:hypothetical protein
VHWWIGGGETVSDIDFFTPGARLALELECLLMDTRDTAVQSRWWDSAHEAKRRGINVRIVEATGSWPNVHGVPADAIERMRARWEPVDGALAAQAQR